MKKFFIILLAFLLVAMPLVSCEKADTKKRTDDDVDDVDDVDEETSTSESTGIFGDEGFEKAFAEALGKKVSEITEEDIAKIESFVYYWDIGNDAENNYQTYAYPVIMLGYKAMADSIIANSEEAPSVDSYLLLQYQPKNVETITTFKNLRVLRTFDLVEVSTMQENCYYTQMYSSYLSQVGSYIQALDFDDVMETGALADLNSLNQLSSLTKLEQLSLEYTSITSLEGIENFKNLKKLDVGNTEITDISPLEKCENLTELVMICAGNASDGCADCEFDYSEAKRGITDISVLSKLKKLQSLNLAGNAISNISPLTLLVDLKTLNLNVNCIKSLGALTNLKKLEHLYVADNHIATLDGVSDLGSLKTVTAYSNKLTDISALSNCTALETLNINNNKLTDISTLSGCTALVDLNAYDNEIVNIGDLSGLDKLKNVSLYNNKIGDLNGLNGCEALETITAYDNYFTGTMDLRNCVSLVSLDISCAEDDAEVLENLDIKLENLYIDGLKKLVSVNAENTGLVYAPDISGCDSLAEIKFS